MGTDDAGSLAFPTALDRDNRIRPRQELTLPRPSWSITAAGPPGENRFVAIVSPSRRSFDGVGLGRQDPIGQFDMSILGRALESTSASGISGNPTGCDAAQVDCASFGAARFEIRETFD